MTVEPCNGSPQQQFSIDSENGSITQLSSGLMVTIQDCTVMPPGSRGAGTAVVLLPSGHGGGKCGGMNQLWKFHSNGTITSRMTSAPCLDVYAHVNPVQAHFCVADKTGKPGPPESEAWKIEPSENSESVTIRWGLPTFSKCLQGPTANPFREAARCGKNN